MSNDSTTAAIQALLKQVSALTEKIDAQDKRLDGLHSFNSKILDEKKDVQRERDAALDVLNKVAEPKSQTQQDLEKMGYVNVDGKWLPKDADHFITREDARDPVKYREAKERAQAAGVVLRITTPDDEVDPAWRNKPTAVDVEATKTTTIDDTHTMTRWVRSDMQTSDGLVHRRIAAEREGFKVRTWTAVSDLPQHVQTKLSLMEKAHAE